MFASLRSVLVVLLLVLIAGPQTQAAEKELVGRLTLIPLNCGKPNHNHKGPDAVYLLYDGKSDSFTELDVSGIDKSKLKPGKRIRIRGNFAHNHIPFHARKGFKVSGIAGLSGNEDGQAAQSDGTTTEENTGSTTSDSGQVAAAVTTTTLKCLVIAASTDDQPDYANSSKITNAENRLFNNSANVSQWVEKATYGHFNLSHGATVRVTVKGNATGFT